MHRSSSITGTSQSGCLMSYPGHSFGEALIPLQPQPTGQSVEWFQVLQSNTNNTHVFAHREVVSSIVTSH